MQLLAYFALLSATLATLALFFPPIRELYLPGVPVVGGAASDPIEAFSTGSSRLAPLQKGVTETLVMGVLALLGALLFAIPLVRIYVVTMRQEGYEKSFVRLLVALPVAVSAVVRIVQDDLALAFALAGIVAAVRFRTTVKDLQDAFFAFAAIAIGLASGTGNFIMAGAASFVLTVLVYGMWRLDVGDIGPSLELPYGGVTLSTALVPGETQEAVVLGDRSALKLVEPADLEDLQESIAQLAGYVRADALRKKKKYNTLVIAHMTREKDGGRKYFEELMDEHASRLVYVGEQALEGSDVLAYQYLVRLHKQVDIGAMADDFDGIGHGPLVAVELKPVGGLRDRLT
ncbi:MAG: DUF4956 domain-containing protein [Gemmatimonadetes bacterium]|nr:DUF4956 domain-containing protein [Gemmatimonadota bacterium]